MKPDTKTVAPPRGPKATAVMMPKTWGGADASGAKSIRRRLPSGESAVRKPKFVTLEESRLGAKRISKITNETICRLLVARLRRSLDTSNGTPELSVPKSWVGSSGRL